MSSPLTGKKLAVFDLDGTLVDAYQAIHTTLNEILGALGYSLLSYDTVRRSVGHGAVTLFKNFLRPEDMDRALRAYREKHPRHIRSQARLMSGTRELLAFLRARDLRIAAATNRIRSEALELVSSLSIAPFFDLVLAADDVREMKPHPEMLLTAMDRLGATPDATFFVGDMVIDLETARRAGVDSYLVLTGSHTREDFAAFPNAAILPDLPSLQRVLARGSI